MSTQPNSNRVRARKNGIKGDHNQTSFSYKGVPTRLLKLVLVALTPALSACRDLSPRASLAEARSRWQSLGPRSYSYQLLRSCECLDDAIGPVTVTVDNGVVTTRLYTNSGVPVTSQAALFFSIDALFAELDSAIDGGARVDAQYDRVYGYPVRAYVDYHAQSVDDEITFYAKSFQPR